MSTQDSKPGPEKDTQRDKNLATEQRPVPSPAEGDRKTVEEDLAEKKQHPPAS